MQERGTTVLLIVAELFNLADTTWLVESPQSTNVLAGGVPGAADSGPRMMPPSLVAHPVPYTVEPSDWTVKLWIVVALAVGLIEQVFVADAP